MSNENEQTAPAPSSEAPAETPPPVRKPVESWAAAKKHTERNAWKFAAARAGERWPHGFEVTEAEYDEAVDRAANGAHR